MDVSKINYAGEKIHFETVACCLKQFFLQHNDNHSCVIPSIIHSLKEKITVADNRSVDEMSKVCEHVCLGVLSLHNGIKQGIVFKGNGTVLNHDCGNGYLFLYVLIIFMNKMFSNYDMNLLKLKLILKEEKKLKGNNEEAVILFTFI